MIPKECKRLIEVDFPIAVVSKHSAREESIRHANCLNSSAISLLPSSGGSRQNNVGRVGV